MKIMQVKIPLQNQQLRHKIHHDLRHQQILNSLEFQLELLVQDKTYKLHNHIQKYFHIVT